MKLIASICLFTLALTACKSAPSKPGSFAGLFRDRDADPEPTPTTDIPKGDEIVVGFNTALPRLTHEEWENTVKDSFLLDNKPGIASRFSQDDNSTIFHNDAAANRLTSNLWKDYQEAAEELGEKIASNDALIKKLIPDGTPAMENEARAKAILSPIIRRAYRRPATEAELKGLAAIYLKGKELTGKQRFDSAGLKASIAAIVQSPQFIYHPEVGVADGEIAKLQPYEIATRMSYAIWKSIPDETLLTAAATGKLATAAQVKAQVARMMADPRATDMMKYFVNELFETKKFVNLTKNEKLYPSFPNNLGDTLKREAELYIEDVVIKNNGGITKLLTSSYTFVNDKTAPLYGVPAPKSNDLTRVDLDPKTRAGIITQIGWLASNATSERTSTIHRGFYVMNRLACDEVPPMMGTDSPPVKDFKTRRDEITDKTAGCGAQCHNNYINPPAFALEAFDAAGVYRTTENGNPIDTSGIYGQESNRDPQTSFKNAVELMKGLSKRVTTHECFVKRAIELLYNRRTNSSDGEIVKKLGEESLGGKGTKDIMIELLTDMALLGQRSDKTSEGEGAEQ